MISFIMTTKFWPAWSSLEGNTTSLVYMVIFGVKRALWIYTKEELQHLPTIQVPWTIHKRYLIGADLSVQSSMKNVGIKISTCCKNLRVRDYEHEAVKHACRETVTHDCMSLVQALCTKVYESKCKSWHLGLIFNDLFCYCVSSSATLVSTWSQSHHLMTPALDISVWLPFCINAWIARQTTFRHVNEWLFWFVGVKNWNQRVGCLWLPPAKPK